MGIFDTDKLRFTVGDQLHNTDLLVETTGQCHTTDTLVFIYPLGVPSGFSINISTEVKVE